MAAPNPPVAVPPIRSIKSTEKAYVRFINATRTCIELIWVSYEGEFVRYKLLNSGSYIDINTFETHPWIALDVHTKDRLHIDKKFVYWPVSTNVQLVNPHSRCPIVPLNLRKLVYITLPLYSLKYRTILEIAKYIKSTEDVPKLDLPKQLLSDLIAFINNKKSTNVILFQ